MQIRFPEEMTRLWEMFKPYIKGHGLREDAPHEVVEAYKKYMKWVYTVME